MMLSTPILRDRCESAVGLAQVALVWSSLWKIPLPVPRRFSEKQSRAPLVAAGKRARKDRTGNFELLPFGLQSYTGQSL
jgi:hypothetical protein